MRSSERLLVSYVMPNYNCGKWIRQAIESVVSQIYRPLELVICDNGSTDESREIIDLYSSHPWITCLYEPAPVGHARATNITLSQAKGDYIIKFDSDDIQEAWHAERLVDLALENADVDIIYGDIETIDGLGRVKSYDKASEDIEGIYNICCISHNGALVKRSVYDELGGYDESEELPFSHDWEFLIRAVKAGKSFLYVGPTGHKWRRVPKERSMTTRFHMNSEGRIRSHSYIRRKHGLEGPCQCGCGATA